MMKFLFHCIARIPLPLLHRLGNLLGWVLYAVSPTNRRRIRENMAQAQLPHRPENVLRVCQETVKSGLELAIACCRQPAHISSLFTEIHGWQHIEAAVQKGQGLLLLTPHLGSYDLAGRYISEQLETPLTAMYKPPKMAAFDQIIRKGRERGKGKTAPTNLQGVKQIIKALRSGEATIVLPDHVPNPKEGGDGVWANFFGRIAFTMTLAGKLAQIQSVTTLFFVGERLPNGRGFALHIEPLTGHLNGDKSHDAQIINDNVEAWVHRFPEQYLFAYNRYRNPTGLPRPGES